MSTTSPSPFRAAQAAAALLLTAGVLAPSAAWAAPSEPALPPVQVPSVPLPSADEVKGAVEEKLPVRAPALEAPPPPLPLPIPGAAPVASPAPSGAPGASAGLPTAEPAAASAPSAPSGAPDASRPPAPPAAGGVETVSPDARPVSTSRGATNPVREALDAARRFSLPLSLVALVVAFLVVQSRVDRRDPKLAAAPITDDLLGFS